MHVATKQPDTGNRRTTGRTSENSIDIGDSVLHSEWPPVILQTRMKSTTSAVHQPPIDAQPLYWPIRAIAFLLSLYIFLIVHSSSLDAEGLVHLRNREAESGIPGRVLQTSLIEPILAAASAITLVHALRTGSISFSLKAILLSPIAVLSFLSLFVLLGASPAAVLNYESLALTPALDLALLLVTVFFLPALCAVDASFQPHIWQSVLFCNHHVSSSFSRLLLSPCFPSLTAAFLCALSSIVLPLDWGTSWQLFPYANLVGCSGGFMIGTILQFVASVFSSKVKSRQN